MRRYLVLIKLFIGSSLLVDLEYRLNFITSLFMACLEAVWSVSGAVILYSQRSRIGGWSFHEALVVSGLYLAAISFTDAVLLPNFEDVVMNIQRGTMDFILTKPVNSQFHATLRRYRFRRFAGLVVAAVIIAYALISLRLVLHIDQILIFLFLCAGAALLLYSAVVIFATVAFWAVQVGNVSELVTGIMESGRYPVDAFPGPVRAIVSFVVPIAFVTTVPAEVILGRVTPSFVLYGWVFAASLLVISIVFWKQALRHYGSASS